MERNTGKATAVSPEYLGMGERLRTARRSRGLSLRVLADRLGVSPSLISQVETGRAKPSVSTLYAIASELQISLDELLFPDAGPRSGTPLRLLREGAVPGGLPDPARDGDAALGAPVQPAATRTKIRLASGVTWERLTTVSMPNVDFFYVTYEVGGASSPEREFQRHAGQEWGYIISGTLGVTIGFDDYVLNAGDALSFDSTTPHRLYNLGTEPVHGIWFMMGRRPVEISSAIRAQDPGRD